MVFIEIARFVARGLKARFRDQKSEFDIIHRHLRPGDIVCDIGANKGSFVLFCRAGAGAAGWSRSRRSRPSPRASRRSAGP